MGSAERMGLGINWYLPGQVSLSLILACLQSGTRVTWRFNSLNEPWDCLENISPVERKRLDYPREGMCTELQQGSAAACDTNVPYRGEVGKLWALRVQILLLWKIGRSPWGPQHWSTKSLGSRRRERERRGGLRHICRSNCWKRTLKTSLLLWQGWFLIINKIPPPWWRQMALCIGKSAHHRGNYGRHERPIASGVRSTGRAPSPEVPNTLQQTGVSQRCPTPGQRTTCRKSRKEKISSTAQRYTSFWKDLSPRLLYFPSTAHFFITEMKISGAYIMQPFGRSKARHICTGATKRQRLGWDISAQDVLLKQLKSSSDFE